MAIDIGPFLKKRASYLTLIALCIGSVLLALPTINSYVSDPNMVVYFNGDEGGIMDLVWYYYSGQKRDSFQWDYDYGLELRYIADIARLIPRRFIEFTPAKFVLVIRWLHLAAWILALVALWRLVGRHFGKGWQQSLAVLLLWARPSFSYFSINLKPEPLVLLFMILGLDYALRMIEGDSRGNLLIAVSMMAFAFLTKYVGIFGIPALIAAMCFAEIYQRPAYGRNTLFPHIRIAWILPSLIGSGILILLSSAILFYVRKSTGHTWYEDYGFWGALTQNRSMRYLFLAAILLIPVSFIIFIFEKTRNKSAKGLAHFISIINSNAFIACALFSVYCVIFGFRWVISPKNFLHTYSQIVPAASSEYAAYKYMYEKSYLYGILQNAGQKLNALDLIMVILFVVYLITEAGLFRRHLAKEPLKVHKRLVLIIFTIPAFLLVVSGLRIASHHMLPFFVAMSVLVLESVRIWRESIMTKKIFNNAVALIIYLTLGVDIALNGIDMVKSRLIETRRSGDVAFEVEKWLSEHVLLETRIVTDFYTRVYVPSQYKNVKSFNWYHLDNAKLEKLRSLIRDFKPEFIYYNATSTDEDPMLPIHEILPGIKVARVKVFESDGHSYTRFPGDRSVVYSVVHENGLRQFLKKEQRDA